MNSELKRKVAFAMLMGVKTTGLISFSLLAINLGFSEDFLAIWLRSWSIGYAIAVPSILLVGPRLQAKIDQMID